MYTQHALETLITTKRLILTASALFALSIIFVALSPPALAVSSSAIVDNDTVQLGIRPEGHLNVPGGNISSSGTTAVGLRYLPTNADGTAAGCYCEGWGVADATTRVSGSANGAFGITNLTPVGFTSDDSSAVSVVDIGSTFRVTHDYRPSSRTPNLYEVVVTIENTSDAPVDTLYRRVMDWDVEPTAQREYVTIDGGTSSDLLFSSNDGFASSNPLAGRTDLGNTGSFTDAGPKDHGALFDFGLGELSPGESKKFRIFYGAAGTESEANTALSAVGAEVFSLGQPGTTDGSTLGKPNTFIFAFSGVDGEPIIPRETTPPADATDFAAAAGNKKADLTWTNPADRDFEAVRIFRSTGGKVADPTQAGHVYDGRETSFNDAGLTNGTAYTYTIFTRDAAGNWSAGVTAEATPTRDTVGVTLSSLTHTYSGTPKSATASTDIEGLEVNFTYTNKDGNPVANPMDAGTYGVTATVEDDDRSGSATGELVIGKAPLSIEAQNASRAYDEDNPTFTVAYSGFVNGEDEKNLGGELSFDTAARKTSVPGEYPVTPGGLTAENYDITFKLGTLEITKAKAGVNLFDLDHAFDGSPKAVKATTTPEGLNVAIAYSQNGQPVENPTDVGSYGVTATIDDVRYSGSQTGVLRITDPAPQTIITSGPEGPTLANTLTFRFTGEDAQSPTGSLVYSYRLNNGAWSKYSPGTAVPGLQRLPDGPYTFQVRAKDPDGHVDATPAERRFVVDTARPAGSIIVQENTYDRQTRLVGLTLSASDPGGTGVGEMRLKVSNGAWSSWQAFSSSAEVKLTDKPGSISVVYVQYRDRAGNPSTVYYKTMKLPR